MAIKSLEIEPTKENLLKTLSEDMLNRNRGVWQFSRFCDAQDGKCYIAIDAKWGAGKTFFIRHVQMLIDSFNLFTQAVTKEERIIIQNAFSSFIGTGDKEVEFKPEVCVYYDAWINDNVNDSVLSLVYEILKCGRLIIPLRKVQIV